MHALRSVPRSRRTLALVAIALCAAAVLAVASFDWVTAAVSSPPVTGLELDQPVPNVALIGANGQPTSLADLHGRYVVLTPFLTLCHEVCPITTGAYIEMQQAVDQAGLAKQVTFVEVTVDPGRDSPARLRAYAQLTGANWTLLTGSPANLAALWKFFGITYSIQPADGAIDWWTHQPETYDVGHNDALFFLDPNGHERIAIVGIANVGGKLDTTLTSLLDQQGMQNLQDPGAAWTIPQALDDLGHLLGRRISPAS
jgi:cytochrome oxidase Cu insertion factor (SCO1/SenC/PrrC family)